MKKLDKYLFATSHQKILSFLAEKSGERFTEKDISKGTGVKKSAVNLALRDLSKEKLVEKERIGISFIYRVNRNSNIIKEIKVLGSILRLSPLIDQLREKSLRIILFGSTAQGLNVPESDIDLFVLSNTPEAVRKIVNDSSAAEKIQLFVKTPGEMLLINKRKPVFFQEVEKGRVLWEKNEE